MAELRWIPDEDGELLTWTCHVCGRRRPDAEIAVWEHRRVLHGVPLSEFVRFCRDDAGCREGAQAFHFVPLQPDEQRSEGIDD